jgi:hypothetical protein
MKPEESVASSLPEYFFAGIGFSISGRIDFFG